ncbi:MAG: hypothetical protein HPY59_04190 [Anaerolineae bacterium]|nr:hypothetical protein [Anaerolineae bacterium]
MTGKTLDEAIELIRAGQKQAGRQILVAFLQTHPHDERAWIWLAYAMDTPNERELALRQFLKANPKSQVARLALNALGEPPIQPSMPSPGETVEKTQPVRVRPAPPATSALTVGEEDQEEEPLPGSTPAPPPKKAARFWVILSVLMGFMMIVVVVFTFWLWTRGSLAIPGLAGPPFSSLPLGATPVAVSSLPPSATTTRQVTPTSTLPPAPWIISQLPKITASNAAQLGQLAFWQEPGQISLSPDWAKLAVFDGKVIQVWDLPRHLRLFTLLESAEMVTDLSYLPESQLLAITGQDQRIQIWDTASGKLTHTLRFDPDELNTVAEVVQNAYSKATYLSFSPGGKYIAGVTYGLASIWEAETTNHIQSFSLDRAGLETLNLEGPDAVVELVFSPDEERYAVRAIGKITVKDISTGLEVRSFLTPGALGVSFSPDGSLLIEAGNGYVALWDIQSGEEILYIKGVYNPEYEPNANAFSPDGKWLAVESEGLENKVEVQVWDLSSKQKKFAFPVFNARLYSLDFSPDGSLLAAGGSEGLARIWRMEDGAEIVQFNTVNSLFFSPGGQALAGLSGKDLALMGLSTNATRIGQTPTPTPTSTPE